ncbi:hypothetical protein I7I48_09370 [Histoplasma ohiense]|nr:hypothetical protein I7I48_09370 [Histoplasma ohiense (nom. inval.)]
MSGALTAAILQVTTIVPSCAPTVVTQLCPPTLPGRSPTQLHLICLPRSIRGMINITKVVASANMRLASASGKAQT